MKYMIKIIYNDKYINFIRVNTIECNDVDLKSTIDALEYDMNVIGYYIYKLEKEVRKDEISKSSR